MIICGDDNMSRIGVCGAFSTGKTTLAARLALVLDKPLIEEPARIVARQMGVTPGNLALPDFCEFQRKALEYHFVEEVQHEVSGFVSDCSMLCYTAYAHNPPPGLIYKFHEQYGELLLLYANLLQQRIHRYTDLVYVPVMFGPENDGVRHTSAGFQAIIEEFFTDKLLPLVRERAPHVRIHTVTADGPDERVAELLPKLKRITFAF
jgi:hypothetical protein